MPKPPGALIWTWVATYLYAAIFWAIEFTKSHKDIAGHMIASAPAGFWYTIVFGGLVMGLIVGAYLAETLSRKPSQGR